MQAWPETRLMGDMTEATISPALQFRDGTEFPQLGLGTWKLREEEAERAVRTAIEVGYRHIDTAAIYQNEEAVGKAIRDAIAAGEVTRDELFVTSKLWHNQQGEDTATGFNQSLERLGLDYLDLYLIHWPWASADRYVRSFEEMAKIQGLGKVQSIGVSNFYPEVLDRLIAETGITPVCNQIEVHPGFSQPELRAYHEEHGIVTAAWSPLGSGAIVDLASISELAEETGRTNAQVILRWHLQLGNLVIPRSSNPERIAENFGIFDFELSDAQMAAITALDNGPDQGRRGADPLVFPEPEGTNE
ncbi:putative oxidoreductase [Corynebacterium kalinowskii]|uniref:Oxidoreductase n=2 Tax=Corynebacterium kalinowskii TaxID=2675216 RepID=A0A6B8VME3_9CORY|nr:putative oxidoreductase [Corynebacterium kalinowskii]